MLARISQESAVEDMSARSVNPDPSRAPETAPAKTILLVDDSDVCRVTTKWFLTNFGFTVESALSAEQALQLFDPNVHDIVITDNSMPGMTGAELAHIIKLRSKRTPVLMYTGTPPEDRSCLDMVIERPAHLLQLKEGVESLLSTLPGESPDLRQWAP